MLERFIPTKESALGFSVTKTKGIKDPVLEGYSDLEYFEIQSMNIMREHLLSTHHGIASGSMEIVTEGLGDMLTSAVNFFKELIKKLVEFAKNSLLYLTSMFVNFEKFMNKHKDKLAKDGISYTVWGYDYTLGERVPKTDQMASIVSEFNKGLEEVGKLSKIDIVRQRDEYMNDGEVDKLRGKILGINSPIESLEYKDEIRKIFRSGETDEKEIKVDKTVILRFMQNHKDARKILDEVRSERSKIEAVYRSLETFFAKGTKQIYVNSNRTTRSQKVDLKLDGKDSTVKYTDTVDTSSTSVMNDTLNYFYSFKWKQAQLIGALSYQAYIERVNAIKEALGLYEKTIRAAIFAVSEKKGDDE